MPPKVYRATDYVPTAALTGDGASLYRMKNAIVRGLGNDSYIECYSGSEDLSETIANSALTGTIATTANSKTVTGTGTLFTTELHIGQYFLIDSASNQQQLAVVDEIASDTSLTMTKAASFSVSGKTGYRLPILFELDKKRGSLLRGNALKLDRGSILAVGDGVLRLNGSALSASLTATRATKIAVRDTGGTYTVYTVGMNTPAAPTAARQAIAGADMAAGNYSLFIVPARQATDGYNNPHTARVDVTGLVAGEKIRITFPAMDTTNGQDSWRLYGSLVDTGTDNLYKRGGWFYVRTITSSDLGGTGAGTTYDVAWLDSQILNSEQLSFSNNAPPDAEFLGILEKLPILISCQGEPTVAKPAGTSPGPCVIPFSFNNPDAAPLTKLGVKQVVPLSPPETIIGCVSAAGRIYLMTANTLQIVVSLQSTSSPITVRPFWKSGFKNPYALCFVNGTLYGFTSKGCTRSIAEGDEGSEEHIFAAKVEEITRTWNAGQVLVAHDPMNEAVCFFHAADSQNSSGYWTTRILMYSLRRNGWIGDVVLSSTTRDMIVSGVATVNGQLEFLAGGRTSTPSVEVKTYRFDTATSQAVDGYVAWGFSDDGIEDRDKRLKAYRTNARLDGGDLQIHGAGAGEDINITNFENGTSSKSGSITLADTTMKAVSIQQGFDVKNLAVYAPRIGFSWDGAGNKVEIHEVMLRVEQHGVRR